MGKHLLFSFPFVFFFPPFFFFCLGCFFPLLLHLLLQQNVIFAKIHLDNLKRNQVWVLDFFFKLFKFLLPKFPFLKSRQIRREAQSSGPSKLTELCDAVWKLSYHSGRKSQIWVSSQRE